MTARTHPAASPHGQLAEVFPDVFFVTGTMGMPGPLPVRFSRNMVVVRDGQRLVIVNSVRLSEEGHRQLDRLGKVTDVVRLAAFRGMDDPFYKERYGAKTWTVKGQRYVSGFKMDAEPYYVPDVEMDDASALPLSSAKLYVIGSRPPEGLLLLQRDGGILISGDCLQNWDATDAYFSALAKPMMRMMGFIKPCNVGPAWLKATKPPASALQGILELEFQHVLPAHGTSVQGNAKERYRPSIEAARAAR
jgi:hypothetical protein